MVSVQPLEGRNGERVRREVARVVRGRRFRVVTEIPKATGTGQYYTWARELGLTAFVVGELIRAWAAASASPSWSGRGTTARWWVAGR